MEPRIRSLFPPGVFCSEERRKTPKCSWGIPSNLVSKAQYLPPSSVSQQINSIIFPLEAENGHDQWGDGLPLYGCEGATGHRGKALGRKSRVWAQEAALLQWRFGVVTRSLDLAGFEPKTWELAVA